MSENAIEVIMVREKETKRKVRFKEPEQGTNEEQLGFIYVPKAFAGQTHKIKVTIEPISAGS